MLEESSRIPYSYCNLTSLKFENEYSVRIICTLPSNMSHNYEVFFFFFFLILLMNIEENVKTHCFLYGNIDKKILLLLIYVNIVRSDFPALCHI